MGARIATVPPRPGRDRAPRIVDSRERILESYADFLRDESRWGPSASDRLAFACDESGVAEVLRQADAIGHEVTVSAGRTGIVGGAVPRRGTLLSLIEMNRVLGLRRLPGGGYAIRAEPGITIADLAERLARRELGIAPEDLGSGDAEAVEAFASDQDGWFYPPDPTEDTAHLGATVATNASGARSFIYGATRGHVLGLRVCLASGEILALRRGEVTDSGDGFEIETGGGAVRVPVPCYEMPATKNAAGYYAAPGMDLVDLFIGSEGTLGIITEVEVALSRRPSGILSALAFFESEGDSIAFVRHARGDLAGQTRPETVRPMALEFFDSTSFDFLRERKAEEGSSSEIPALPDAARAGVIFEQGYDDDDGLMAAYEGWDALLSSHGSSMDDTWGGMEAGDTERLRALRHSLPEQVNNAIARAKANHPRIHKVSTDIAVPHDALETMLEHYRAGLDGSGLEYVIFGHIGDSHLHLNVLPRDAAELSRAKEIALDFARAGVELGGTVSAEHGIGKLKHEFLRLMYGERGLDEMAAVKRALDPRGILNRDVMLPEELL